MRSNTSAKMRCLLVYFEALRIRMPQGHVVIQRRCVDPLPWEAWRQSSAPLCSVDIREDGIIEDAGPRALQCDFANKYIGGGVLSRGCVQEEIMFIVAPELIVSILVTEVLEDNEVVFITGADQFAAYEGYGSDFRCVGAHREIYPGQRTIVAMDALMFQRGYLSEQVGADSVLRELNKARAAFLLGPNDANVPIATGNWGCGAFGGDPELKAIIQVMAASLAKRLRTSMRMLGEYKFNVGMLAQLLLRLAAEQERGNISDDASVLEWISDNMGDVDKLRRSASAPKLKSVSSR
jgi:poly(ADP-ribose) glycohydrolase